MTASAWSAIFAGLAFRRRCDLRRAQPAADQTTTGLDAPITQDHDTWVLEKTGNAPTLDVRVDFPDVRPAAVDPEPGRPLGRVDPGQQVVWRLIYHEGQDRTQSTMRVWFRDIYGREQDPWTTVIV